MAPTHTRAHTHTHKRPFHVYVFILVVGILPNQDRETGMDWVGGGIKRDGINTLPKTLATQNMKLVTVCIPYVWTLVLLVL